MQTNAQKLKLTKKLELCNKVYLIDFQMDQNLDFSPGQFVVLQLAPRVFRSYSIVDIKNGILTLLIDTKVGGEGSKFFEESLEGTEINLLGKPSGVFKVANTTNSKVFVATGTGLAPFIPMIKETLKKQPKTPITLYFGCRHLRDEYASKTFEKELQANNFKIESCITRDENIPDNCHKGRVTEIIPRLEKNFINTEFYLCGNPKMVEEMRKLLVQKGAINNIYFEKYGA
ncbi:hypothetical protein GF376_01240 [Candidatus Peregrinibacteria bacterium]|nr:hypothetical protein [Candidatus Peregrinibacteria bacterium]